MKIENINLYIFCCSAHRILLLGCGSITEVYTMVIKETWRNKAIIWIVTAKNILTTNMWRIERQTPPVQVICIMTLELDVVSDPCEVCCTILRKEIFQTQACFSKPCTWILANRVLDRLTLAALPVGSTNIWTISDLKPHMKSLWGCTDHPKHLSCGGSCLLQWCHL